MDVLKAATCNAATAANLDTGSLEAGKLADVMVVDGDPLEDVAMLLNRNNIKMVIKEGRIVKGRSESVLEFLDFPVRFLEYLFLDELNEPLPPLASVDPEVPPEVADDALCGA